MAGACRGEDRGWSGIVEVFRPIWGLDMALEMVHAQLLPELLQSRLGDLRVVSLVQRFLQVVGLRDRCCVAQA